MTKSALSPTALALFTALPDDTQYLWLSLLRIYAKGHTGMTSRPDRVFVTPGQRKEYRAAKARQKRDRSR